VGADVRVVAIDPGRVKAAAAVFEDGVLVWAGTVRCRTPAATARRLFEKGPADVWVIEKMRYYSNKRSKHDSLDSVEATVDMVVAKVREAKGTVKRVYPSDWKRQTPKKVCEGRCKTVLSDTELAAMADTGHDTWDAIGIGLVHIGRARPGMVPR
jgi:hypothetical protein